MTSRFLPRLVLPFLFLISLSAAPALASPQRIELGPTTSAEKTYRARNPISRGDRLYFVSEDPVYGYELWQSDGTPAGSRRLTDICPGSCSSFPSLVFMGDRLFLLVTEFEDHSLFELVDGELSLVVRFPGYLHQIEAMGNELLLQVSPGGRDLILYRSSGAAGDLRVVEKVCEQNDPYCDRTPFATHGDAAYYLKGDFLRRLDPGGEPQNLLRLNDFGIVGGLPGGRFVFRGCSDLYGCRYYASDGTAAGTIPLIENPRSGAGSLAISFEGKVFWVSDGLLWITDGSPDGTFVLTTGVKSLIGITSTHVFYTSLGETYRDVRLRALSSAGGDLELLNFDLLNPEVIGVLGNSIFLAFNGQTLHVSDGTPAGTRLVNDVYARPGDLPGAVLGGRLYSQGYQLSGLHYFDQLWVFDEAGNAQPFGTRKVAVGDGATPVALGASLIAWSDGDPAHLWRLDPQTLAAAPVVGPSLEPQVASEDRLLAKATDFVYTYYGVTPAGVELLPIRPFGAVPSADGKFYWGVAGPGQVLWETDGTVAGTRPLHDFSPGWIQIPGCNRHCSPSHPSSLRVVGNEIYLVAAAATGAGPYGDAAVWVYHRDSGEAVQLQAFQENSYTRALDFFPVGDRIAFELEEPAEVSGLWVTDGTPEGTRKVLGRNTDFPFSIEFLAAAGEQLFFLAGYPERKLWASDLTAAGTHLLLEGNGLAFDPSEVAVAGDHVFFAAFSYDLGLELWTSDGTPAGTRAIDLRPGPLGSRPSSLLAAGSRVIFGADDGRNGHELYQSDGTREGTTLLADIAPGKEPSSPANLVAAGDRLFFSADDGQSGRGLWYFDLPAPRPACPADRLCLQGGRFEVTVSVTGMVPIRGNRVLASAESGVLSFFSPDNWELLVKVLDGCAINQYFWVYSAAATDQPFLLEVLDRATGTRRTYRQEGSRPAEPVLDGAAFASCGAPPPPTAYAGALPAAAPAPRCADDPAAFCFGPGGRFRAKATWQTAAAGGFAHPLAYGSRDSGLFSFFSPSNWELMVKVLDGCAINGRHWVFVAGTTDVGWQLEVEDRATGAVRRYGSELGNPQPAITDTDAFAGCS
jgi:ELWxxDGT repeat protein